MIKLQVSNNNPAKETIYLELRDFEAIVSLLVSLRKEFTEDIPPFKTRYAGILESIVAQIKAEYFGKELYRGVVNKAVWMFYCLIKNHPFINGNKRIAVVALFTFLKLNCREILLDENAISNELYSIAVRTSESKPEDIESVKKYLKRKISGFIIQI